MRTSEIVTVRIAHHSQSGVDLLPDVVRQLNAMIQLLKEFTSDPRFFKVEVLSISKNSDLTTRLRTVTIRDAQRTKTNRNPRPVVRSTTEPYRRLERAYTSATAPKKSKITDPVGLTALSDCAKLLKEDVATIETAKQTMVIDAGIIAKVESKLGPIVRSFGSTMGVLESLNIHSKPWTFTIYPEIGPKKIRCAFEESLFPEVRKALGSTVAVRGVKEFVADSPWPLRISAESVIIKEPAKPGAWLDLLNSMDELWNVADEDDRTLWLEEHSA